MARWDVHFHRTILEASGNQILIETWNSMMIEARTFVTLNKLKQVRPDLDLVSSHNPIIEAIIIGDPERCGFEMRKHVEGFGEIMNSVLNDSEPAEAVLTPDTDFANVNSG